MHKLNVCVGDSQYRLVYCIYVEHKESGISVYRDKDFDVQEVINRLPSKFTIEKEQELLPKGVNIKIHKYSINCAVSLFSNAAGKPLQANVLEHIEDIILNIKDHYETFAVIPRGESKLQVYMTISNGTNGAEGCIINPMEDVLNVLKDLRKCKGVTWSQLLEVGIDNADDLYWWYVTFSIDTTAI